MLDMTITSNAATIESFIRSKTAYITPTSENVDLEEMRKQVMENICLRSLTAFK